jgi:hypothetical protein
LSKNTATFLLKIIKDLPLKQVFYCGGRGGTRTLKPYRQRILSPQRIPIPPLALKVCILKASKV